MRNETRCLCCLAIVAAWVLAPSAFAGESLGPWAYGVELEVGCAEGPFTFPSDHARVEFFRREADSSEPPLKGPGQ